MDTTERRPDVRDWMPAPGGDQGASDDSLNAVREAGERFLRAGDRAIDRALSGDSESFLRSIRQESGE